MKIWVCLLNKMGIYKDMYMNSKESKMSKNNLYLNQFWGSLYTEKGVIQKKLQQFSTEKAVVKKRHLSLERIYCPSLLLQLIYFKVTNIYFFQHMLQGRKSYVELSALRQWHQYCLAWRQTLFCCFKVEICGFLEIFS